MGPRQKSLGNNCVTAMYDGVVHSFNGAEAKKPRKSYIAVTQLVRNSSFNGAEAKKPRKYLSHIWNTLFDARFNGAEAKKPRK